jgi:small-conductance mechanosensitive channel
VREHVGTVREINIRETQLVTFDGELVVVPNRDVYKNVVVVNTFGPHRRLEFRVGIGYDADVDRVIQLILEAVASLDGGSGDRPPQVLVDELGASAVDLRVLVWTSSCHGDALVVRDAAIREVKRSLDAAGVSMPPQVVQLTAGPVLRDTLTRLAVARDRGPRRTGGSS